jgi:hypothetical protein
MEESMETLELNKHDAEEIIAAIVNIYIPDEGNKRKAFELWNTLVKATQLDSDLVEIVAACQQEVEALHEEIEELRKDVEKARKQERERMVTLWDEVVCPMCYRLNPQHASMDNGKGCLTCEEREDWQSLQPKE